MNDILVAKDVTKKYFNKDALNGINFSVPKGKIVGLLGPNGSGKTTFLKISAGILRVTDGEILIDGHKPGVYTKSLVSYLPDKNNLYKWMRIKDSFQYFKDFFEDFDYEKAEEMLKFMDLNPESKITALSKGMLEKLQLTLILSRKAKLYILDEPLGGVDPTTREKILDAILEAFNPESSILITTHLVSHIERLFDDVAFISEGKIILQGSAEELRNEKGVSIDELYREVFV